MIAILTDRYTRRHGQPPAEQDIGLWHFEDEFAGWRHVAAGAYGIVSRQAQESYARVKGTSFGFIELEPKAQR